MTKLRVCVYIGIIDLLTIIDGLICFLQHGGCSKHLQVCTFNSLHDSCSVYSLFPCIWILKEQACE